MQKTNQLGYILIPEFTLGSHHYPEIEASLTRASNSQYPSLPNTGTDLNSNQFIGNINHETAIRLNNELNGFTPSIAIARQFLKTLIDGIQGKLVYFADGSKVQDNRVLQNTLDDIVKVSSPRRAEWLDSKFLFSNCSKTIKYPVFDSGILSYHTEDLDPETLMEDRQIDLKLWLRDENATSQGLPKSRIRAGRYSYWHPRNNYVSRFVAYSGGAVLVCVRDPRGSSAVRGVRHMRLRAREIS